MWYDDNAYGQSWSALWSGYTTCGVCSAIRQIEGACQICGDPPYSCEPTLVRLEDGREMRVPACFTGAEGRFEDYVYLQMMEREWKRPLSASENFSTLDSANAPSPRAAIVLVFWSYFETRLERLLRAGMRSLPTPVTEDLLQRYSPIGARLDRLYRIAFGTTYFEDLDALGYSNVQVCLRDVHQRRNEFAHGNPRALDDSLVLKLIMLLKAERESWIAAFNLRTASPRAAARTVTP